MSRVKMKRPGCFPAFYLPICTQFRQVVEESRIVPRCTPDMPSHFLLTCLKPPGRHKPFHKAFISTDLDHIVTHIWDISAQHLHTMTFTHTSLSVKLHHCGTVLWAQRMGRCGSALPLTVPFYCFHAWPICQVNVSQEKKIFWYRCDHAHGWSCGQSTLAC